MSQPYKNWCFTCNNFTPADEVTYRDLPYIYLIYGREVGAEGTPHLQGYIQFKTRLRLSALKKLHPTCHWEPAKGDQPSNFTYCSKEGDFVELGTPVRTQGGKPTCKERAARNKRLREEPLEDLVASGEIGIKETVALKNARLALDEEHSRRFCPPTRS